MLDVGRTCHHSICTSDALLSGSLHLAGEHPLAGSDLCLSCPPGTYRPAGVSSCLPCADGRVSAEGSAFCSTCPAGSYSDELHFQCVLCPGDGATMFPGASSAEQCTSLDSIRQQMKSMFNRDVLTGKLVSLPALEDSHPKSKCQTRVIWAPGCSNSQE